jgi:hypothetical protein
MKKSINILEDQAVAGFVQEQLNRKAIEQAEAIATIASNAAEKTMLANEAFSEANSYIEQARDFVSPTNLNHILGNKNTKHGEIAEQLEVCFRNGRSVLNQEKAVAELLQEGKDRLSPTDYTINGIPFQSKFYHLEGSNSSLIGVVNHLKTYPGYANDTTPYGFPGQHGEYHIPKDQYDAIQKVLSGDTAGMSSRTIRAIEKNVKEIETLTGKHFDEVVKPAVTDYHEVQLGRVDDTINAEEQHYEDVHQEKLDEIREEKSKQTEAAKHITDASWAEAFKAAGIAAAISGTVSAGIKIYSKIRDGKPLGDFDVEDWKEVGFDFAKGGAKGGISGLAIYGLTKLGGFSAPFAGAMVSSSIGITSLYIDYKKGKIDETDFSNSACALSVEAGMAAVGAAIGQAIIPIPVVGAIVGSVVAQSALKITQSIVGDNEKELIEHMQSEYRALKEGLNIEEKKLLDEITKYFDKLGGYIEAALNKDTQIRLYGSVELCRLLGIPESGIMKTVQDVDVFMLS